MDLSEFQVEIGALTNDPGHDRYTTSDIGTELDAVQSQWNVEAAVLKDVVTLTTVAGTQTYAISTLTGTPIRFLRVTHAGLELVKTDKLSLDMATGHDWSVDQGTPTRFYVEAEDPDVQQIVLYPIPQDADAGANLKVEYVKAHTPMSASTDEPFNSNTLTEPYHSGIAYCVSYRLLLRDPSPENLQKASGYKKISDEAKFNLIQVFTALEKEEPWRLKGTSIPVGGGSWRTW